MIRLLSILRSQHFGQVNGLPEAGPSRSCWPRVQARLNFSLKKETVWEIREV